jgi:hypothetical protein
MRKRTKNKEKQITIELLQDATIRKSLDQYIKNRIKEIPTEIKQTFPHIKQI